MLVFETHEQYAPLAPYPDDGMAGRKERKARRKARRKKRKKRRKKRRKKIGGFFKKVGKGLGGIVLGTGKRVAGAYTGGLTDAAFDAAGNAINRAGKRGGNNAQPARIEQAVPAAEPPSGPNKTVLIAGGVAAIAAVVLLAKK